MPGLIREEIDATALRRDVIGADIRTAVSRPTLCKAGRGQDPVEVDLDLGGDQVAGAFFAYLQAIDLLEAA